MTTIPANIPLSMVSGLQAGPAVLIEAYKKHSAELLALEASQEKLVALVLATYSAGATIVAGLLEKTAALHQVRWPLVALALLIGAFTIYTSQGRNRARRLTRQFLVRVEAALDFYRAGAYLADAPLYDPAAYVAFPSATFLNHGYWIAIAAGVAFIATLLLF